jgi:uncharacterized membrane protein (DUF4010 family)
MTLGISPERLLLLLGLAFFFGLSFEEFYRDNAAKPPGGVRTFPLLALAGAGFYLLEPSRALPFAAGLLAVGAWLFLFYRARLGASDQTPAVGLVAPVCNLLAYLLGPLVLWAPIWVGVSFAVAAVLLLGAREPLHALARQIPPGETATLGKFLILTGIVLPLLPNQRVTTLTAITPYQMWLAVVAVSTLSYGSYLAQRYALPRRGSMLAALLGGLYSSTATTVVLARRLRDPAAALSELQAGIVLATAMMYLRLVVVVGAFNLPLARALFLRLAALSILALLCAVWCYRRGGRGAPDPAHAAVPRNPLELSTALLFALLFAAVSLASAWAEGEFGNSGLYWLGAIVGVADIDPFVLSVAQNSAGGTPLAVAAAAVLIAASSNNLLKAAYAVGFGRLRPGAPPAGALVVLGAAGIALAFWFPG